MPIQPVPRGRPLALRRGERPKQLMMTIVIMVAMITVSNDNHITHDDSYNGIAITQYNDTSNDNETSTNNK